MKWPFRKKEAATIKPAKPFKSQSEIAVEQLREWRGIGETFRYLGREMVVTGHGGICIAPGLSAPFWVCELTADYVDNNGVIRSCSFSRREALALMRASEQEASA